MDFRNEYQATFAKVTASQETHRRIQNMANKGKYSRAGGSVLRKAASAAAIISLMVVTASAAEIGGWLKHHFSQMDAPLSDSQVALLDSQEQTIGEAKTSGDWTIELRSAMNDGTVGYVIFGVTAPEGVSLETRDVNLGPSRILIEPEGVNTSFQGYWEDDGDGKANTMNHVLEIYPTNEDAFGPDKEWTLHIENVVRTNWEDKTEEVLAEGLWDFPFTFTPSEEGVELIQQPLKTTIDVTTIVADYDALATAPPAATYEDGSFETVPVPTTKTVEPTEVTISSFILGPLSVKVVCDADSFVRLTLNEKRTEVVMKDGSKIPINPGGFNMFTEYTMLQPLSPIVLEEVDHILFPDGTKLPMP